MDSRHWFLTWVYHAHTTHWILVCHCCLQPYLSYTFFFVNCHRKKAKTNSSKSCVFLLWISVLNKMSTHLYLTLDHSLCKCQWEMHEQGTINPIYYTLSSDPGICVVKPGLLPCSPVQNWRHFTTMVPVSWSDSQSSAVLVPPPSMAAGLS